MANVFVGNFEAKVLDNDESKELVLHVRCSRFPESAQLAIKQEHCTNETIEIGGQTICFMTQNCVNHR